MERRISVFKTTSLESCLTNVDRWTRDNPIDYIEWIFQEIEENIELVHVDERWYERSPPVGYVAVTERGMVSCVMNNLTREEKVIVDQNVAGR